MSMASTFALAILLGRHSAVSLLSARPHKKKTRPGRTRAGEIPRTQTFGPGTDLD